MKLTGVLIVFFTFFLTGCATSIPQAKNFPQTTQKKAMAAQHWGGDCRRCY